MKLLLDTCISPRTRDELATAGHEVVWVGDWPADPGDDKILEIARRGSYILITLDKDFGELAVAFGHEHCGILRLVDIPVRKQASLCLRNLKHYGQDLQKGAIVTVEPARIRVRPSSLETDKEGNLQ
jgi:predicted nuclease of predicted toxin-antitoxin system